MIGIISIESAVYFANDDGSLMSVPVCNVAQHVCFGHLILRNLTWQVEHPADARTLREHLHSVKIVIMRPDLSTRRGPKLYSFLDNICQNGVTTLLNDSIKTKFKSTDAPY